MRLKDLERLVGSANGIISVLSHGAIGDGVTDDTAAIQQAHDAAGASKIVFYPPGFTFLVTDTISAPALQSVMMYSPLIYSDAVNGYSRCAFNHGENALANNMEGKALRLWVEMAGMPATSGNDRAWGNEEAGCITIYNLRQCGDVYVARARGGHFGLRCVAKGVPGGASRSFAYNDLRLGEFINNRKHLWMISDGGSMASAGETDGYGWLNQNTFVTNKFRNDTQRAVALSRYGVVMECRGKFRGMSSNYFIGPSFELNPGSGGGDGESIPFVFVDTNRNYFARVRCEKSAPEFMVRAIGKVTETRIDVISNSAGQSRAVDVVGPAPCDVSIFENYRMSEPWVERWRSGDLSRAASDYDGAGSVCVRGMALRHTSGEGLDVFKMHATGIVIEPEYIDIPSNRFLIVRVKFDRGPKAIQLQRIWDGTRSGRLAFQPYDSDGNLIGPGAVRMPVNNTNVPYLYSGSISGTTLTLTGIDSGAPALSFDGTRFIYDQRIIPGTRVIAQLTGDPGGVGTYTVNNSQDVAEIIFTQQHTNFVGTGGAARWAETSDIGPNIESQGFRKFGLWTFTDDVAYVDILLYGGMNSARLKELSICSLPETHIQVFAPGGLQEAYDRLPGLLATAAPSIGTWPAMSLLFDPAPIAGGMIGRTCVQAGTAGTLVGVTGSVSSASAALTVNSATDLRVGQYITIAGVTGIKRITAISGTTVTIDSASDATVSDAAIAYSAPVFQTFGSITLSGSLVYDPPNLASNTSDETTLTVTGAALGDFVQASWSADLQGVVLSAYVSAANTVTLEFVNPTVGAVNLAEGTARVRVTKP